MIYKANSYNLGFVSDAHCRVHLLDKVREKHPEIEQWFFLGDLVDFQSPWCNANPDVQNWFTTNKDKFIFIKGNHDHVTANGMIKVDHSFAWELAQFHKSVTIRLPDDTDLFLCHSKPRDFWSFIDAGVYTEREFVDDFNGCIDNDTTRAVVIGHNHKQFTLEFPYIETSIWSVGSIKEDGSYAVLTEKGIQYKRL